MNGDTGKVAFDDQGDRINAEYNIANIQKGNQTIVGQYFFNTVFIGFFCLSDITVIVIFL